MNYLTNKVSNFLHDPWGHMLWRMENIFQECGQQVSTACNNMIAWFFGVKMGKGCRFYGISQFKRYPGSSIQIGERCKFRSNFRSNMVGINHVCGISTHRRDARIIIGNESGFSGTIIAAANSIKIGDGISCGGNVTITDFDWHNLDPTRRSKGNSPSSPIIIGNNVWLGLNCLVLKGCTIGDNAIIGANSVVVNSSIPANVIVAGNPARVLRPLQESSYSKVL